MNKLRSYGVVHRELIPDSIHGTSLYANNRSELSNQPTRARETTLNKRERIKLKPWRCEGKPIMLIELNILTNERNYLLN